MKGNFHVGFWNRDDTCECSSTIISSHPKVEADFKGLTVRQLKWYVSWV